jgi:hypothetical protein
MLLPEPLLLIARVSTELAVAVTEWTKLVEAIAGVVTVAVDSKTVALAVGQFGDLAQGVAKSEESVQGIVGSGEPAQGVANAVELVELATVEPVVSVRLAETILTSVELAVKLASL